MKRKTLSVVVPVYFNAGSLPLLFVELQALERDLDARGLDLELIFVNDGSGDNSLEELLKIKAARPATKVISLSRNFGAVAASKTGFQFATGDAMVIQSADLQDPSDQILAMVDQWLAGNKFVVSARVSRGDPASTRAFAWIYYRILEVAVVRGYPKGGFDLMLLDGAMMPYMKNSTKHTNPNLYAYWLGFTPVILSYDRRTRTHGTSRWTFWKKVKFLVDTVSGFSVVPIRTMSAFGILVAIASFAYGLWIFVAGLFGAVPVQGFATLAVLISFFSGLILGMLGVLGEYLWRVFDAVNSKPESVIDETFL